MARCMRAKGTLPETPAASSRVCSTEPRARRSVEPDRALRTALLAMLAATPYLRPRVTVIDSDLFAADLPDQIGGLVAMNVIGHFSAPDRARIWAMLRQRLVPSGRAVLTLHPPTQPESVPEAAMGEVVVGQRRYSGTAAAEPAGDDAVTWTMRCRVEQGGSLVTGFSARDHGHVLTPEPLWQEVAQEGLRVLPGDSAHGLQVIGH